MKVPDYWWKEYTTHSLNDGRIVSFDESSQKWDLLLHTQEDGDDLYPMAYAAVCEYSDKQSSSYQDFVLPVEPIFEGFLLLLGKKALFYSLLSFLSHHYLAVYL
jgi:hypothetical protein